MKKKPPNTDVKRRNSHPKNKPENDSDMQQHPTRANTKVINKIFTPKLHHLPKKADTLEWIILLDFSGTRI